MAENWPDSTAVESYLTSLGITAPDGFDFDTEVEAVVAEVSSLTGWDPFLQTASSSSVSLDPPLSFVGSPMKPNNGVTIPLPKGLLVCDSVVVNGRTLVQGTDYWLMPAAPWRFIRLAFPFFSKPQTVVVTGKWGYSDWIPADLYRAVRDLAAYQSMAAFAASTLMSGLASYAEGDVREAYTADSVSVVVDKKRSELAAVCAAYRRVDAGL